MPVCGWRLRSPPQQKIENCKIFGTDRAKTLQSLQTKINTNRKLNRDRAQYLTEDQ